VGKYLNEYEGDYTPAGFERWYGYCGNYGGTLHEFRENGVRTSYSRVFHHDTYLMRDMAVAEVTAPSTRPFFLALSFNAPHKPSYCAPEDEGKFGDVVAPRTPPREEEDVSDKPMWVRGRAPHNAAETADSDEAYRKKMRAMPSVTRAINAVERALDSVGKLEDTYFIFTSDNGYRYGEHGIDEGKRTAYEEDLATPMFVRGPGIVAGSVFDEVALNIDIAPTILELANVAPLITPDGRSLAPVLRGEFPDSWRDSFLIEYWRDDNQPWIPTYQGVRTRDSVYVEYEGGETEFYDLATDPYELQSRPADASPELKDRLAALRSCSGSSCREGD
jgi:arylsulfatase A-like enzyme